MRLLGTLPAAGVLALGVAAPALAHPFGPPPEAAVTAEQTTVTVVWTAEQDDLFTLGQATGALPQRQTFVFEDGVPVDSEGSASIEQQLAAAGSVRDYLGSHIEVGQDGDSCRLADVTTERIHDAGARLTFHCPRPVTAVELGITVLTDLDPNYRTVARAAGGARTLHTAADPVHVLQLTGTPPARAGGPLVVGGALAGAAAVAGAVLLRLRSRRAQRSTTG